MQVLKTFDLLPGISLDASFNYPEESHTVVKCRYTSPDKFQDGGWVNIWSTTYLVNTDTIERLQMLFAYNIPLSPAKHHFQRPGQVLYFVLIFPKLPENWNNFHVLEVAGERKGFSIQNIQRQSSGVYLVFIH